MNQKKWNDLLFRLPRPHLLQSWQWGQAKKGFGWNAHFKQWEAKDGKILAAAQILEREIFLPIINKTVKMLYVPKGPIFADWQDKKIRHLVLADLKVFARERNAFFIKIDPDITLGFGIPGTENEQKFEAADEFVADLKGQSWRFSKEQVQMRNTMLIDLLKSEDELLSAMKQKTRYNVRLGIKKGVTVRVGSPKDFEDIYEMYAETSIRDGFVIRNKEYYFKVWQTFFDANMLKPLVAEVEGKPVAGLMLFIFKDQAWYIYGMSRKLHREKMPNYLLQWEAMRHAKKAGCEIYDLWGAPDEFNDQDPMWGVYRFKKGLAAYEARRIGAWDLPINQVIYLAYSQILPWIISVMRWRGKRQTKNRLSGGLD